MNRLPLVAAAALAAVVLAGCASTTGARTAIGRPAAAQPSGHQASPTGTVRVRTTDSAAHTSHHVFAAFGPGGAPTAGVRAHRSGSCFTASITVAARTAYRCLAGNTLLDPCFVVPSSKRRAVDCYASPWSSATRVRLTKKLPRHTAPARIADPWALRLADGSRCVVTTGTSQLLRGVAMRYQCGSSVLAGLSRTTGQPLMALVRAGHTVRQVAVAGTWSA